MTNLRRTNALVATAAAFALVATVAPATASDSHPHGKPGAFRGEAALAPDASFEGTAVGGLSSITYDRKRDLFYAISDARPELGQGPWRYYSLRIDVADGNLEPGDVQVVDVTLLTDAHGVPFPDGTVDPEGLALTRRRTLVVTSEGFAGPTPVAPFVREFGLDGRQLREFDLRSYVDPVPGTAGVRQNLGIESAGVTRGGGALFTGFENALVQDGPEATLDSGSPARLQRFDPRSGELEREYVYVTDPVAEQPQPAGAFTVNGLVELLPVTRRHLVAMERSFSVGAGNTIRLYGVSLRRATDVAGVADLDDVKRLRPARKSLLFDLDRLGLTLDNIEGLTLGPRARRGGRTVLLVSDNNFTPGQVSQFLLFVVGGRHR